jgi:hypothetical protein
MSLNVIRFEHQDRARWGVLRDRTITPIAGDFPTTGDLIRGTTLASHAELDGPTIELAAVRLL